MFVNGSGQNKQLYRGFSIHCRCFLPSLGSFGQAVSEKKIFRNWPTRNKNYIWRPCLLTDRNEMSKPNRGSSIDASHQVICGSFGPMVSEKTFRNWPTRNKNCLWRPCLLMDRDKISILYRGSSIDASYQVWVHLGMQFQGKRCLEIDQSETKIAYGGHVCIWIRTKRAIFIKDLPSSIDASYQVSVHLTRRFQRRRLKCEKITDNRGRTIAPMPLARWAKNSMFFSLEPITCISDVSVYILLSKTKENYIVAF